MDAETKTKTSPNPSNRTGSIRGVEKAWIAHVVPHTHWDREWYQPFETFRARLVSVVDDVLELLTTPEANYPCFTLDGQAIVIEDYLDVRPQQEATIARLVREGRLRIGPWYVLADEFLVSPEALVRNLEIGHAISHDYGGSMHVAYTPDSFGHIAQLPRLASEFGHKAVVFERGMGDEAETLGTEFHWRSPDGKATCLAVNLMGTYSSATALGHIDWEYQDAYDPNRAVDQVNSVLFGPEAGEPSFPEWLRTAIERIPGGITSYGHSRSLLLLNGSDHLFPQRNLPDVIQMLNERIDGIDFKHSDVEKYVDDLRAENLELKTYAGEFRSSRYHHVLSGVWSTRMPLKQRNHQAETLLERYAEPLFALSAQRAEHDDFDLLRTAWKTLLQNHPHDSICGCSIDAVDRQMHARNDAVDQLGQAICDRAIAVLTRDTSANLAVFEPIPQARWTLVEHTLEVPEGQGLAQTFQTTQGQTLPWQGVTQRVAAPGRSDTFLDRVHAVVAVPTHGVGITPMHVRSGEPSQPSQQNQSAATNLPDSVTVGQTDNGVRLVNDALAADVRSDGTIALEDRASGRTRQLRLWLEDDRDAGDSYDFSPVAGDAPVRAWATEPPTVTQRGPLRATVEMKGSMTLPAGLNESRTPVAEMVELPFRIEISLDAFTERLGLQVHVENAARDHRLRLVVASDVHSDELASDGHWHLLRRPVNPEPADHWYQRPVATVHQRRFSAVSDGENGLGVLVRGLPEVEARSASAGVEVAVTLLRSIGWLSRDDMTSRPQGAGPALETPGAQCLGAHTFELALVPFQGTVDAPRLHLQGEQFQAPARMYAAGHHDPRPDLKPAAASQGGEASVAPEGSLQLTPPLMLSAMRRRSDQTTEYRIYNPTTQPVSGSLLLDPSPVSVQTARLDGSLLDKIDIRDGSVALTLEASEVVTLSCSYRAKGGDT